MPTQPPEMPAAGDAAASDTVPVHRFRAANFDEAVALARAEFGEQVEVVEANRIRRGGIGGFFATDLGVEIVIRPKVVATSAPTFDGVGPFAGESAIDRLLALVDAQERAAREPAATGRADFAAALAHELRSPAAEPMSSADWSVEAYRRLAIPAVPGQAAPDEATTDQATDESTTDEVASGVPEANRSMADSSAETDRVDVPARPTGPRSRRHASRNLAARLEYAARVAVEPAGAPEAAVLPFVTGAAFETASAPTPVQPPVAHVAVPTPAVVESLDEVAAPAARPADGEVAVQTMDLITQAATALFGQLGTMPVVAGSQAANVRKLTVSVTSPLGKVIEISAELGDQGAPS